MSPDEEPNATDPVDDPDFRRITAFDADLPTPPDHAEVAP